ncbi:MAG: alpha/beta hydrolase [Candidatus Helarchaeota archaeon]|nr:alpha/beta hydrolase [Candidatus Helarchaeota archaeon]
MSYFRTDRGNKIYYEWLENPNASETLVFVHGWAESHRIWREQVEFFKKDYQLLLFDLRGFGLSSKPTYGYSLKLQSKALHGLIQSLGLKAYWLVGHSLGGMITLQYAEKFSQEMRGAVVIDTTYFLPIKMSLWRNLGTFFISKTLRQIWLRALKSSRLDTRRTLIQDLINDADAVPLYVSAASGLSVVNFKAHLSSITCPVLIIVGENDDLTPVDLSQRMHEKLLNSRLEIIKNTGHMSFLDKPEEINALIASFFKKRQLASK